MSSNPSAAELFARAFTGVKSPQLADHLEEEFSVIGRVAKAPRGPENAAQKVFVAKPSHRVAWYMGPDGMAEILQNFRRGGTMEALVGLGFQRGYVEGLVEQDFEFELLVMSLHDQSTSLSTPMGAEPILASWEGVRTVLASFYPAVLPSFDTHTAALKSKPFAELEDLVERECGYRLRDVHLAGEADERFLTYERWVEQELGGKDNEKGSGATLANVRRFLYHEMGARDLFAGDGFTYTSEGLRGCREYFVPNLRRSDLQGLVTIPLPDPIT